MSGMQSPIAATDKGRPLSICTIGDLILDIIVLPNAPIAPDADTPATIRLGAGGQAANVAAWTSALGARSRLICKRGTDPASRLAATELARYGVEICGPVFEGRGGVVVSVSGADGQRTMAQAAIEAASLARRVTVDLASAHDIEIVGPARFAARLAALEPDVVFATEAEQAAVPDFDAPWVIKLGARGARFPEGAYPARSVVAVDTTGAGDALAAGYLVGGPECAIEAAARAVGTIGAMPPEATIRM